MNEHLVAETVISWCAVFVYICATVAVVSGLTFKKERMERVGYLLAAVGLVVHGAGILFRWYFSGHGPYLTQREVLSADAWILMVLFLCFRLKFPKINAASIIVFPATFLLIALGVFTSPEVRKIPPTLRSVWLVLHVLFYKIAVGTVLIAFAMSVLYLVKISGRGERFPDSETLDVNAYRFAGFGFVFWAIAMLAGSIWAYESWGRFWGWDPVETWSLVTWGAFGVYLHLRRFFRWQGRRAAWFYIMCFVVAIIASFFTAFMETSIHAEYFK